MVEDAEQFRQNLLGRLEITQEKWSEYWEEMKTYRDEGVAHHQSDSTIENYPTLELALQASYYYYDYLYPYLRQLGISDYPESLEHYYKQLLTQAIDISETAYSATKGFEDLVR